MSIADMEKVPFDEKDALPYPFKLGR